MEILGDLSQMNHVYESATAHTQLKDKSKKVKAGVWRERQTETEKQKPTWDLEGIYKPWNQQRALAFKAV